MIYLNPTDEDRKITDHFRAREFECPCCKGVIIDEVLVEKLEKLREKVGMPILITSGYRCSKHNREVGGAPRSLHTVGKAADIVAKGFPLDRFFSLAVDIFPRVGIYRKGFLHVDLGSPGRRKLFWIGHGVRRYTYYYSPEACLKEFLELYGR